MTAQAPDSAEQTLAYESRVRSRQAVVAVVAAACLIIASIIQLSGPHAKVNELTLDLLVAHQRFPRDLIGSVVNAVGSLTIAWTLVFLHRCSRARDPVKVRPFVRVLAITGGALAAVTGVVYAVVVAIKVHEFATTGAQTYAEASHLTSGPGLLALQLLGQLAALLVAVSFVLVSLQAMNTGLLPRFMGYLGMFAGALVLFQITQVPIVQCYWLLAFAYLASGRWPSGVPAAWRTGRAEPWPSSAEMRARRVAAAGASGGQPGGGGGGALAGGGLFGRRAGPRAGARAGSALPPAAPATSPDPAGAGDAAGTAETPAAARTRATTPKRKRKRRG